MRPLFSLSLIATKRTCQLQCRSFHKSVRYFDPLRILFCGSDEFSVASLEALNKERLAKSSADIESIDVVCRPGKRTGAGLKVIRHLPIRERARQLSLPLHEIDTFTGWQPPAGINLIIAVSFGLFVPPRILNEAKYGGLNVHPSMLPDLRGPAPIHWTILLDRKHTGVTLQTLHPKKIDHGNILAQTAPPGMSYPHKTATTKEMIPFMATKGADLLVKGLRHRVFESTEPITHSEASILEITDGKGISHAPKITPEDRHISSWEDIDATTILRKNRAIGHLWDTTTYIRWTEDQLKEFPPLKPRTIPRKRIVFSGGFSIYKGGSNSSARAMESSNDSSSHDFISKLHEDKAHIMSVLETNPQPGQLIFLPRATGKPRDLIIFTSDCKLLRVHSCTIAGGAKDKGVEELWAVRLAHEKAFKRLLQLQLQIGELNPEALGERKAEIFPEGGKHPAGSKNVPYKIEDLEKLKVELMSDFESHEKHSLTARFDKSE